jgi:hypothetical protein
MYKVSGYRKSEFQPIERLSDEQLADLAEIDPVRLVELILAARQAGLSKEELRATWLLASSPQCRRVIERAVSKQTFNSATHELDELCDGAHLEVLQQIGRTAPTLESLAQFHAWISRIARFHVAGVTRLVREKARLRTLSLGDSDGDARDGWGKVQSGVINSDVGGPDMRIELAPEIAIVKDQLGSVPPIHREVIIHHLMMGHSACSTADQIYREFGATYSAAAIAKVVERFRSRCSAAGKSEVLASV